MIGAACATFSFLSGGGCSPGSTVDRSVIAFGTAESFDVGTWNLEWFGSLGNGPEDEALQEIRVASVLTEAEVDVWGVQEVVDADAFRRLVDALPGYDGILANDPFVKEGSYYRDFNDQEQKVGVLYRSDIVAIEDARVVLSDYDYEFAGRPPMEITFALNGMPESGTVVVVVLHAKAGSDSESYLRRISASEALHGYLSEKYEGRPVFVIGDFNDDVDRSISGGRASPYQNFVQASDEWSFTTSALSLERTSTTVSHREAVDHHLVSNAVIELYERGSAAVLRPDRRWEDFSVTVSDHLPVVARYGFPGGLPTSKAR